MRLLRHNSRKGSALLIVLAAVTLITILAVFMLVTMRFERSAANLSLNSVQADALADFASATAIERLREAIDEGRQPPDANHASYTTWASEPGRIHIYTINQTTGAITHVARDMFSAPPGPDASSGNVDLNEASYSGIHAITGTAPGTMKIGWTPILANPDQPASASNPAMGRVAYWVDDDSCKVDINTADGSANNDSIATQLSPGAGITAPHFNYGFGTPSQISFQAFPEINALAAATGKAAAAGIADYAANTGFNSEAEIQRVTNVPDNFYTAHQFDLTTHSLTPELTMFGEPRTNLTCTAPLYGPTTTVSPRAGATGPYFVLQGPTGYNYGAGWYYDASYAARLVGALWSQYWNNNSSDTATTQASGPIDFVYPAASQLAGNPPLFQDRSTFGDYNEVWANATPNESYMMPYWQRVANSIYGKTSSGQIFHWPAFAGSTTGLTAPGGFGSKYNLRQIDDITLQIFDMSNNCAFADQMNGTTVPSISFSGILNTTTDPTDTTPRTVSGLGRSLKLTEIFLRATTSQLEKIPNYTVANGNSIPTLQLDISYELYFPAGYAGTPLNTSWGGGSEAYFTAEQGSGQPYGGFNLLDSYSGSVISPVTPSYIYPTSGYWTDTLWQIQDSSSAATPNSAGFDLTGNSEAVADPDQTKAQANHPYEFNTSSGLYNGGSPTGSPPPALPLSAIMPWQFQDYSPGTYHVGRSTNAGLYIIYGKNGVAGLNFQGGLTLFISTDYIDWLSTCEFIPNDALRFESPSYGFMGGDPSNPAIIAQLKKAVIPIEFSMAVPDFHTFLARVSDPLVNQFPGDWEVVDNPDTSAATMPLETNRSYNTPDATTYFTYCKGGTAALDPAYGPHTIQASNGSTIQNIPDFDGDNPGFKASGGGDPLSVWLPRQDVRYPKQSRFPSVGALNYVRTGRIPDDLTVDLKQQKGTAWRSINLSATASASQKASNVIYPDWAMLDLFTVPFLPQKPWYVTLDGSGNRVPGGATPLRELTFGGATEGKLNINNPKTPYPFDQTIAGVTQTPPTRTAPLDALFYGLQTVVSAADYPGDVATPETMSLTNAQNLRDAVQNYLAMNGAFMLPGQLAEVPAIDGYTYTSSNSVVANASRSRNDIMRQVVGATTTQSNTYTIWVVAQTFKKAPGNTNYGTFEAGDIVTGQVRHSYAVERYIETGKDGVPGNAHDPGPDGIVGTADDPIDPDYNPALSYPLPYRYRITHTENIKL